MGHTSAALFVATIALVFFTWGEVYSLLPSACADFFGAKNASSNYGFIYSAKGVASIMGGGLAAQAIRKNRILELRILRLRGARLARDVHRPGAS